MSKQQQHSDDELITDLKRVASDVDGILTAATYRERGRYSVGIMRTRFGSWNNAKELAGLETTTRGANHGPANVRCPKCGNYWNCQAEATAQCHECMWGGTPWRARIELLKESDAITQLARDGPQLRADFVGEVKNYRELVRVLDVHSGGRGSVKSRPPADEVVYLVDDEREAMRVFIRENQDYVADCLNDTPNPLTSNWEKWKYELLQEMWAWMGMEE